MSLLGTGRSSTGKTGFPVSRASTKRNPLLSAPMTTGTRLPSCWMIGSVAVMPRRSPEIMMDELEAHTSSPLLAPSATTESSHLLSPGR